jgi:hypothetical protein
MIQWDYYLKIIRTIDFHKIGKQYKVLTDKNIEFIKQQKLFYIASSSGKEVNLSPKGYGTIRVLNNNSLVFLPLFLLLFATRTLNTFDLSSIPKSSFVFIEVRKSLISKSIFRYILDNFFKVFLYNSCSTTVYYTSWMVTIVEVLCPNPFFASLKISPIIDKLFNTSSS